MPASDAVTAEPAPAKWAARTKVVRPAIAVGLIAAVLLVPNAVTSGNLLAPGNMINVLRQITYNAILGIGQTFVIITAGIDLSIGSLISLCGVVMALFVNAMPFNGVSLVVATLIVGLAVGAIAGYINALPVVRLNLPPFITTLATLGATSTTWSFPLTVQGNNQYLLEAKTFGNTGCSALAGCHAATRRDDVEHRARTLRDPDQACGGRRNRPSDLTLGLVEWRLDRGDVAGQASFASAECGDRRAGRSNGSIDMVDLQADRPCAVRVD